VLCAVSHTFAYWTSSSVVSRDFFALCAYSMYGHHPHPLGYPCAKFHFCGHLYCWASTRRKITYSINHSFTHSLSHSSSLFDAPGTEAFASEQQDSIRAYIPMGQNLFSQTYDKIGIWTVSLTWAIHDF